MKIIGHRGAKGLAPENTLAAFKKALELGVDMIELDVRVTADKVPILGHNRTVRTATGRHYNIKRHDYAFLKNREPDLTTLQEALDLINGKLPIDIEVKPWVDVSPIIRQLEGYKHEYLLSSYSRRILIQLDKALPEIPKAVITSEPGWRSVSRAKKINTKILVLNQRFLLPGIVRAIKRHGYTIYSYTVNSPKKAKRLAEAGVDGIFTNYPNRFI